MNKTTDNNATMNLDFEKSSILIGESDMAAAHAAFIDWQRNSPNNLSYWFPHIQPLDQMGIFIPRSVTVPIPEELLEAFGMENKDDEAKIRAFIGSTVMPLLANDFPDGDVFIRNGCFSDKFDFSRACHLKAPFTPDDVYNQIMDIQYKSLMFDTCGALELVFREYIPAEEGTKTIYNGMPLRPEMRLFYDFDRKKVLYDVNYWDWDYCHEVIGRNPEDKKNYVEQYGIMTERLAERREKFLPTITKALAEVEGLTGRWSVDFMLDEDRCWLIDMAIAERSAYWDEVKASGIGI